MELGEAVGSIQTGLRRVDALPSKALASVYTLAHRTSSPRGGERLASGTIGWR
jgi:hypothetical protein